ncbi:unnamed protein product [Kluyveromyces dobzhanskii CBS 2104]|uniref:WGS project CCBQ000000000 data, contig 00046 n=1 Tax=Kluyveromyces dobzhanskii CBS 2104 TaxID=1427455 RepID=A0A0A8L9L1_9SACH|nr:unnamed protein product [Kluyveromyces dobzhanskii CBS 2104]
MSKSPIFNNLRILIIKSSELPQDDLDDIMKTVKDNGASECLVYELPHDEPDVTITMDKTQFLSQFPQQIHCIISKTVDFSFYRIAAFDFLIPVVLPKWVDHCLQFKRLMRTTCYSPNLMHFLKDCYIYVSKHSLNRVEYQFYCSIVTVFGGTCMDYLSTKATHIITWDKDDVAIKAMQKFNKYKVTYLMPNWLVDCLCALEFIDEERYLIDINAEDSTVKQQSQNLWNVTLSNIENWKVISDIKLGKKIVLGDDLALPGTSYKFLLNWIKKCLGAEITLVAGSSQLKDSQADVYIGYSDNTEGVENANECGILCANIPWLFYVWQMQTFVHPMSKLLLSPLKRPVFRSEELKATFTNYYGEQRYYIQLLVEALGGVCSTELTKKNTHLISAIADGKKYEAACAWECCISVNHLWLESCYKSGQKLDPQSEEFQQFPAKGGLSNSLGQMTLANIVEDVPKLDDQVFNNTAEEIFEDSQLASKENSISIAETSVAKENDEQAPTEPATNDEILQGILPDKNDIVNVELPEKSEPANEGQLDVHEFRSDKSSIATPLPSREPSSLPTTGSVETLSQPLTPMSDNRRKAKAKAAEKLHDDIESLNEFQKINKRKRSPEVLPEVIQEIKKQKALDSKADEMVSYLNISHKPYRIKAVLTNCHENLSDLDMLTLSKVGIIITPEIDSHTNTIIAPKKARTAKFLKSFSLKPLKYALTPMFITDILSNISKQQPIELEMSKYFISDIDSNVLEKTKLSTKVFARHGLTRVNLSDDIPGGQKLISSILKCHGMEEVNAIGRKFQLEDLVENKVKKKSANYILIASKASAAKKFNKCVKDADKSKKVFVVEWNWCVKSIFDLDINLEDHEYVIYNK